MKCINCNEVELTGRQRQFCSGRCSKAFSRKSDRLEPEVGQKPKLGQSRTDKTHEDCAGGTNSDRSVVKHPVDKFAPGEASVPIEPRDWMDVTPAPTVTKPKQLTFRKGSATGFVVLQAKADMYPLPDSKFAKHVTHEHLNPNGTAKMPELPVECVSGTGINIDEPDATLTVYDSRSKPESLNWGDWMTIAELEQAGLKANRAPIPGDHDYSGVCEEVDGVWQVRKIA